MSSAVIFTGSRVLSSMVVSLRGIDTGLIAGRVD
jgi:hypothetical protein